MLHFGIEGPISDFEDQEKNKKREEKEDVQEKNMPKVF